MLAGFLAGFASLGHATAGEKEVIYDVQNSKLSDDQKLGIRVSWHMVTIDFIISTIVLMYGALTDLNESTELLIFIIGLHFLLYSIFFFLLYLTKGAKSIVRNPQWVLLLSISILSFMGLYF